MQIKITAVHEYSEGILATFKTEFGEGFGIWNGNKKPAEGDSYSIELDITEPLKWGKDIVLSKETSYSITVMGEMVTIIGKLQRVDVNGLSDLLVGNSIIQLEIEGKGAVAGKFVALRTNDIELYPY